MWSLLGLLIHLAAISMLNAEDAVGAAEFVRGVNLNGNSIEIDGHVWLGNDSVDLECNGNAFENQSVVLKPKTDRNREAMIRSSRWGSSIDVRLKNMRPGDYRICLYVWEDNAPENFELLVNQRTVIKRHSSGTAGQWKRLGPWPAKVSDGVITISARGGAANLSGVEVWGATGKIPDLSPTGNFNRNPTPEQLAFFESKIRPVLVEHCYNCHSSQAKELGGGLLLDSHRAIVQGGDTQPPIVAGDPEGSLLVTAIRHNNKDLQMPPESKLADHQIQDIEQWIRMGAPDPRLEDNLSIVKAKKQIDWTKARDFWSLRPLAHATVPSVTLSQWPDSDLDRLVLSHMEAQGLVPAEDSDRTTWIRRATYDLIGLPPTSEDIDRFVDDSSSQAHAKVIDRLLAMKEYGERWGRHWLDIVRYSDSAGDNSDFPIPQISRYRDWVIDAVNADMPYDQFVRQQLAGDLMPADTEEETHRRLIATGYIAGARRFGSRVDDYPQHLTIEDTLDNLGRAFLAMTINCARCHDHKFDPITTEDYYALYGFFHSTRYPWPGIELEQRQRDLVPLASKETAEKTLRDRADRSDQLKQVVTRVEEEKKAAKTAQQPTKDIEARLKEAKDAYDNFTKQPLPFEVAYAVIDAPSIEDSQVQVKGDPAKLGSTVKRRFLTVLGGSELTESESSSGRLRLADWIVDRNNPLTARVLVNRIWLHHFGRGLVPTPNDFGRQGQPPTHPELLDWLANRLIQSGWSLKAMHREIMLSRTYRMSSRASSSSIAIDPTNQWLSRFPRRRLDAESIRDTLLNLSGNLDLGRSGPHPFPPSTQWKFTQHNPFKAVYDSNHRSVYLMTQRIQRHPYLAIFDGADPAVSTPSRTVSTTPLQALYFLNDPFVHDQAVGFAKRLLASYPDRLERIQAAYRLALGRQSTSMEVERAQKLLEAVDTTLSEVNLSESQANPVDREAQAWQALVRSLFRLNEFIYVD